MKEHPILFNTEMVKAILSGDKTQTRRIMRRQPDAVERFHRGEVTTDTDAKHAILRCYNNPKGFKNCNSGWLAHATYKTPFSEFNVGDHLWVRETFRLFDPDECGHSDFPCGCPSWGTPLYRASHDCFDGEKWTPSIHMPRSASRILLEITNIRVERLQDITKEDAKAEGFDYSTHPSSIKMGYAIGARTNFHHAWSKIYGSTSWNKNPWVWVLEFKRIK
ncbi:hypothetical protein [Acinetobacter johnsonii]|uniref:hypothetical protein n=1 Tax=Acinetobacter johnsonii TaxID=40214 RepID=UPI003AF4CCD9